MTAEEALAISNSLEAKKNIAEAKRKAEELKVIEEERRKKRIEQATKKAIRFLEPMIKERALHGRNDICIHWTNYEEDDNMFNMASDIGRSKDVRYALFELGYSTCWFEYPYHDTWSLTVAWGYEESIKALSDNAEKVFNKEERQKMINVVNERFGMPAMNYLSDSTHEEAERCYKGPSIALIVTAIALVSLIVIMCTI